MAAAVLYDLEFTAWEGSMAAHWLEPGQFREVVQIGAVRINTDTLAVTGELNLLVRPRLNPVISPYLENLTGITNVALAASGVDFKEAYSHFVDFADGETIASFGRDDLVLIDNLRLYAIHDAPRLPLHLNFALWMRENGIDTKGLHACDVAHACGSDFKGRPHDAFDDARSLLEGLRTQVKRGTPNIFKQDRRE